MSKRSDFLFLIQTSVLLAGADGRTEFARAMKAVATATLLPEEAIPKDVISASSEFSSWLLFGSPKPDWVTEHEENLARHAIPKDKACVRCGNYTNGTPYCSRQCAQNDGRV